MKLPICIALFITLGLGKIVWAAGDTTEIAGSGLRGGLGYDFSLTWDDAKALGFTQSPKPGQESVLSKLATDDFFPLHQLVFTYKSKQLLKIGGWKFIGKESSTNCANHYADVLDLINQKYPALKKTRPMGGPRSFDVELCEQTKLWGEGPVYRAMGFPTQGLGKCVKLSCYKSDDDKESLMIEYWNKDIYEEAQAESAEKRKIEKESRMRDLDPSKL